MIMHHLVFTWISWLNTMVQLQLHWGSDSVVFHRYLAQVFFFSCVFLPEIEDPIDHIRLVK